MPPIADPTAIQPTAADPAKGPTVDAVNPDGKVVRIAQADADRAFQSGGYAPATPEQVERQRLVNEQEKGNYQRLREHGVNPLLAGGLALAAPGGEFAAWREGGISGASGGLAQAAVAEALGSADAKWKKAYTKELEAIKAAYPTVYGAGEVAGNIARDATLASIGVMPSASLEAGVYGKLGGLASRGALGRAAARGLSMAAAGGVENAVLGASRELSEEILGDHELSAEKIVAAGGREGLMGALFGGALGAGGSLAVSGLKAGARAGVDALANHADDIRKLEYEQYWKALSPAKKYSDEVLAKVPGGKHEAGEVLGRYGVTGNDIGEALANGHPEGILPKVTAAKEQVGRAIGEIHGVSKATVTYGEILDSFAKHVDPLRSKVGHEGIVNSVDQVQKSLADKLGITAQAETMLKAKGFDALEAPAERAKMIADVTKELRSHPIAVQDVIYQRKALDDLVYKEAKSLDPNMRVGTLRDIRRDVEGTIKDAIDTAAKSAGDHETGAQLRRLSRDYQVLSIAEDAAERSTSAYMTNRNVSLSGQLAGNTAAIMTGSPVLGVASGFAHQFAKERGNAVAALAFRKLADIGEMARQVQRVNVKLDAAAKGLVGQTKALPKAGPYRTSEALTKRYADVVETLAKVQADPERIARAISSTGLPSAPKTSTAVALSMAKALAHLAATVKPPPQRQSMGGPDRAPRASVEAMQRTVRAFEAITDQEKVLDNIAAGVVRRTEINALREVSPKMWGELQARAMDQVAQRKASGKPMSHQERLRLGVVFGVPTDPSLEPARFMSLQKSLKTQTILPSQKAQGPSRPVKMNNETTGIDRIEVR